VNGKKVVAPGDVAKSLLFTTEYADSLTCAANAPFFSEGTGRGNIHIHWVPSGNHQWETVYPWENLGFHPPDLRIR
jgi:hypothetical protein